MTELKHLAAFRNLLGEGNVLSEPQDIAPYETGARYDRGRAALVLRPRTTEEVSACMAYCVRHGLRLIAQSGNTGLVSGATPDMSGTDIVLSLDRLRCNFELNLDNRSLRADSGFRLSEVNSRLEPHRLTFPIDVGADPRLGGMLATNTGGARFLRYGDVRRNTLGLTVVLADEHGTVLDLNAGLRKNNTGVDWKHIFIGTSGAFGIITECTVNLEPLPAEQATAYLVPADSTRVMPLLRAMEAAFGPCLSAFEGMSRNAISAALAHVPSLRNPFQNGQIPDFVILIEISRNSSSREAEIPLEMMLEGVLAGIFEGDAPLLADAFIGPSGEMWSLRHALSEGVKHQGRLIAFDLAFRRADVMAFRSYMADALPTAFPEATICDFGHLGDGGLHFNLVVAKDSAAADDPGFEQRLRNWVYAIAVERFAGSFSAEHGVGRKNQIYYDRYTAQPLRHMAASLKSIISPGLLGAMRF